MKHEKIEKKFSDTFEHFEHATWKYILFQQSEKGGTVSVDFISEEKSKYFYYIFQSLLMNS